MPLLRIVTLNGEVFYSNGPVLSASGGQGILSRPRRRKELEAEILKANQTLSEINISRSKLEERLLVSGENERELSLAFQKALEIQRLSAAVLGKFELSVEKAQRSMIWQQEQVERIRTEIQQAEVDETKITNDLTSLGNEIKDCRMKVREKTAFLETLSLDEMQGKLSYWQTQAAVTTRALEEIENNKRERQETWTRAVKSLSALQERKVEMASDLRVLEETRNNLVEKSTLVSQEIEDLRAMVLPAETELAQVERILTQWISTDINARQALSAAEHQYTQARIHLSRRQEALDSLRRRIEDDFGLVAFEYVEAVSGPKPLPLDGMVEELPKVMQIAPDLEENVQRQRALLRRMGAVNPEAQTEYHQVKERFEFLTTQVADLHKAESDIREGIAELDLLMEREFRKTFDAVAQEFRQIFTRLFGGGMAKLVLTDPEDMTDTGIDIEARLPGRREQGLSLLSGGERSLTAAALVFALLRISPTPFCILDEVDAMLDEANVGRFRELLLELSAHTQFIIITHNRNTVQAASVIYGVTMGRDSASQVISLKVDELTEEYGVQHG
jgi:chromosome segregation protein